MKKLYTFLLLFIVISCNESNVTETNVVEEPKGENNLAHRWALVILEATANDTDRFKPRPTVSSRFLALIFTSMFDAWSKYDEKANSVYAVSIEKRPTEEHTLENKEIAISYAAYTALNEYYFSDSTLFNDFMNELGFNPKLISEDLNSPENIGILAAKAVIEARKNDGSNQLGNVEDSNGNPYSDYTSYSPVNTADINKDINRWQPKYFTDSTGNKFAPGCLTPFWHLVKPLALDSASQFRPGPPPLYGSEQLKKEVAEVVELQANLTYEQKGLVEFMRDGPHSVQQAGHWLKFALDVSKRDQNTLDDDIKLFFLIEMVAMDCFIACWDSKMYYDYARPYALVHEQFKGQNIKGWGGPDKGIIDMKGEDWRPYSPDIFLCPPFPAYTSGHSTVSGGCAEALKLFTGSDVFGIEVKWAPGSLTEINDIGDTIVMKYPTFTETAEMAGISRVYGGYHIQADNIAGLLLGRDVANFAWKKYNYYIGNSID